MAGRDDKTAAGTPEGARTGASPMPAAAERRRNEDSLAPPDAAKESAYPLRETVGSPTGRRQQHRRAAEEKERDQRAGSLADRSPSRDRTGAVAPPQAGKQPGASAELEGTPGAPAAGRGRQTD